MTHPLQRLAHCELALIAASCWSLVLSMATCWGDPQAPAGLAAAEPQSFLVGVGKHDITGPALDCGFMGFANPAQRGDGIHMRLWARAFVVSSPSQPRQVAIVSADLGMIFQAVKQEVVRRLQNELGNQFDHRNVLLTATHTHSGPGGYSHYPLYNRVSGGFDEQNFEAVVEGIVAAILQAHRTLRPGVIRIAEGELIDANWNRSRPAYRQNPQAERAAYVHDVDRSMTLLRFEDASGTAIGMLNWFSVHPTNIGNRNTMISGDNKGYASRAFERRAGKSSSSFVAAFAQASCGDASPNLWGTPDGVHDHERMEIIGNRQFGQALELYQAARSALAPELDYRHTYLNFAGHRVDGEWAHGGKPQILGRAAIGVSKLAGAEDGPGFPLLKEGLVYAVNWPAITLIPRDQARHFEKPIILITGREKRPLTPGVLPLQLITMGSLAIIAAPFEINTMVGRRLQDTVLKALAARGITHAVVAGLSNAYAGYVATREEYSLQHYEGASTHFGPFTCDALRQEYHRLARALATGAPTPAGPKPRNLRPRRPRRQPGPDALPGGTAYGDLISDAPATIKRGSAVQVSFWAGHPRHHLQTMSTYLKVERLRSGEWQTVATDDAPETRIRWRRSARFLVAEVEWRSQDSTPAGTYRLGHHGHFMDATGVHSYQGASRSFDLTP